MSFSTVPGHDPSTNPLTLPDNIEREAELFVYKYAVGGGTQEGSGPNHWALVAKFNDLYVTIDGLQDQEKILQGNFFSSTKTPTGTPNTLDQSHFKATSLVGIGSQVLAAISDPLYYMSMANLDLPSTLSLLVEPVTRALVQDRAPVFPSIQKIKISPRKLLEIARKNPENNKRYILTVNDCQSWAVSAANMLRPYKIG